MLCGCGSFQQLDGVVGWSCSLSKKITNPLEKTNNRRMERLYFEATKIARQLNQVVGEKNDYYITLAQLEELIRLEQLFSNNLTNK